MDVDGAPRAARLSAWSTAVLQGRCDEVAAAAAIVGADVAHEVTGLPGRPQPTPLPGLLELLGGLGVTAVRYAPAAAGDVSALPGPAAFNSHALASGGAGLALGPQRFGLVAQVQHHGRPDDHVTSVTWDCSEVSDRVLGPVDLRDASRRLTEALHQALEALDRLDVSRSRPEALDLSRGWSGTAPSTSLPPGAHPLASTLLDHSTRLRQVVALALQDEGAAVTGRESGQRRDVLRDLDRVLLHIAADAWNHGLAQAP